jgi:hypothetical protein
LPVFDLLLRWAGGVLATLMAAGFAILEAVATPGLWAIPITAAILGNAFLVWFAQSTVSTRWAWLVPAVPWCAVMLALVDPTSEGDVIANSWTGLITLAAGTFVFFLAVALRAPRAATLKADIPR